MAEPETPLSRREQRRRTEARILATASTEFSRLGYDRTTIRAVAAGAGVDPGLVMHYFGSKQELFRKAAGMAGTEQASPAEVELLAALPPGADLLEALLADLRGKLGSSSAAELAILRSMLTHPDAASGVRSAIDRQMRAVSTTIAAEDAELRTGLVGALLIGITVGRDLLGLDGLADASPDRIVDLLEPCLASLLALEARRTDGGPAPDQGSAAAV